MGQVQQLINGILHRENVSEKDAVLTEEYKLAAAQLEQLTLDNEACSKEDPQKSIIGRKIHKVQKKIAEIKKALKEGNEIRWEDLNEKFRSVAGRSLSIRLYAEILHHAHISLKDPYYRPPLISLLTNEENELIENSRKYKQERDELKNQIINAKKLIQENMPDFLGNLSNNEYDKRKELTKMLSKIMKELR